MVGVARVDTPPAAAEGRFCAVVARHVAGERAMWCVVALSLRCFDKMRAEERDDERVKRSAGSYFRVFM